MMQNDELTSDRPAVEEQPATMDNQSHDFQRWMETTRGEFEKNVNRMVEEEVRTRINNMLKNAALVVGLLGGLGFIGLITKTIPDTVEARVKSSVEGLSTTMATSVKERTDLVLDEIRKQAAKAGEDLKGGAEQSLKEAKESAAALVEEVKKNASDVKTLKDQLNPGAWIVLQTDYGDQDAYMGALKGAILCEDATLRVETITSENPDYDLGSAGAVLADAAQHYPAGTVFLIVVNPGAVVSDPIVLHTKNDLYFVAYDNGCLDAVARRFDVESVRLISNAHRGCTRAEAVGNAFTWLAPTAAWLARSKDAAAAYAEVGSTKSKYEFRLPEPRPATLVNGVIRGEVLQFDRFGNARTNIPAKLVLESGLQYKDPLKVKIGEQDVTFPYVERYGDVESGKPLCVIANGYLQFAANRDSFRTMFKVKRGASIEVAHALLKLP